MNADIHLKVNADQALAAPVENITDHHGGGNLLIVVSALVDVRPIVCPVQRVVVGVDVAVNALRLFVVAPEILDLLPVGGLEGLIRIFGKALAGGFRALGKAQIQACREGDNPAKFLPVVFHDAQFAVCHLEHHTGNGLPRAVGCGPQEHNGVVVEIRVPDAVFVIGDQRKALSLFQPCESRFAIPDGGAGIAGQKLAVKFHHHIGERLSLRHILVIIHRHGAVFEVHGAVDVDAVVDFVLSGLLIDTLGAGCGVIRSLGSVLQRVGGL